MKLRFLLLLTTTLVGLGCGYSSNYTAPGSASGSSRISGLLPSGTGPGAPAFTLTVSGSGFRSSSVVFFNAAAEPTTYLSPTQVPAMIPAGSVSASGTIPVYVRVSTGGGMYGAAGQNSNSVNFTAQ